MGMRVSAFRPHRRFAVSGCLLLALALSAATAVAQTSQPVQAANTIPYSDPTFGFEMQLPAGWVYDHGIFQGPEGALGLVRGESRGTAQALQVFVYRKPDMPAFDKWLETFEKQLGELHRPHKVVEQRRAPGDRPQVVLLVAPEVKGVRNVTRYLCIPFDPSTVWVFVLVGTVADQAQEDALAAGFDQVAASVRVLYDAAEVEEIGTALKRGVTLLDDLRARAPDLPIDATERYYTIAIGDKPAGYLLRWMRRDNQALDDARFGNRRKDGLRVHEESWRFADDGTVRRTELNLFSSFDLRSELIENATTQVPAPDVQTQRLYIEVDQGIREDAVLFSSFSTNLEARLPAPRPPLPIGPGYLDLAWVRVLPSLLVKAPAETYAFWTYDSRTRSLTVQRIRPLGPGKVPGPQGRPGYIFESREGFAPQSSRIYTDALGNVVRIEAGNLVLAETTREVVDRDYAQRRDAAQKRIQPIPRPPAPP